MGPKLLRRCLVRKPAKWRWACSPDPAPSASRLNSGAAPPACLAGMVFVVNTVLAWLMFSIDVRNAMLR